MHPALAARLPRALLLPVPRGTRRGKAPPWLHVGLQTLVLLGTDAAARGVFQARQLLSADAEGCVHPVEGAWVRKNVGGPYN